MSKFTQSNLIDAIAVTTPYPKAEIKAILAAAGRIAIEELETGAAVSMLGLGTLERVARSARQGRNPSTGEAIQIPAHHAPKFKPSKPLKDALR